MKRATRRSRLCLILVLTAPAAGLPAEGTVATSVYARIGNGYERKRAKDGTFRPEFYALSNGGRFTATGRDNTVDRVSYPQVAQIATHLLAGQNYHYARTAEQADLLIVLQWGSTIGPAPASEAKCVADVLESTTINERNARILGYMDALSAASGLQRYAGAGTQYDDLLSDIEEARYYIVISAYDFGDLVKRGTRTLLWQTRVSVRSPGNSFDDSVGAMLKAASRYFGQDSGELIRGEAGKGTVEFGDLKFLGEVKKTPEPPTKGSK